MAVYQFSALSDGQPISFNASADQLNFDQTAVGAGDLNLVQEGSSLHVIVKSGTQSGKDIFLSNTALEQIAGGANFTFADGSVVRIGDNTVGTAADAAGNNLAGGAGRDLLMGLGGNDTLAGGDNNDSLVGGTGNDNLNGNNGNDWMEGSAGNDTLTGSGGQDTFIFREAGAANADSLPDFATNWDAIQLDAAGFSAIGAAGRFSAGDPRFFAGAAAHDADDRIIFNSANGQLLYDPDGNGAQAAQLIATLGAGRTLVAGDITVIGTPGGGGGNTINGTAGNDTLIGTAGPDTINGLGGNDSLNGLDGADSISGGDGNDVLNAGPLRNSDTGQQSHDADTLDGGLGDDLYIVHPGAVISADAGGMDTVEAWDTDWTLGAGLEDLHLRGDADGDLLSGTGNELNNVIDPSGIEHGGTFHGLGGDDTIFGAQKDGTYFGDDGNDVLHDEFTIGGQFFGGNGNDTLIADVTSNGSLTGGAGNDSFVYLNAQGGATITDFASGVDKIHLDASGNMSALGASGNFSAGDPRFFAGAGATSGHDADDRVIYDTSTGALYYDADGSGSGLAQLIGIVQNGGVPAALGATDIFVDNGTGGGQVINGTANNDSLVGGPGNDTINGFAGDDTIDGRGGADSMVGGDGNDLYFVDDPNDIIVETQNGGIDEARSDAINYTLPDFVNNLTLFDGAQLGTGNAINNVITGTTGFNALRGLDGDDTLIGNGVSGDTFDQFTGGNGNDSMVGGNSTDVFFLLDDTTASYGQDTIVGGGQSDNWGDRIFAETSLFQATTGIVADLGAGTLTGGKAGSSVTFTGIESVFGTHLNDRMVGNAAGNELSGGAGNDTLDGGAGNDLLLGGADADSFLFTVAPGAANEDELDFQTGVDQIHLDARVMTALGATGNFSAGDARFFAGTAAHDADDRVIYDVSTNTLWYDPDGTGATAQQAIANVNTVVATDIFVDNGGGGGGGAGQLINGGAGNDTLSGGSGNDTINGNDGNDSVLGGGGNDTLSGNNGADSLEGGLGNDRLIGGGGQDAFTFREFGAANADAITDFASNWDRIQVDDAAFTAAGATGRFAAGDARFFAGAGASAGHDADDRFIFNTSTGQLYYDADGSGAGGAQLVATVQAGATMVATDINVI